MALSFLMTLRKITGNEAFPRITDTPGARRFKCYRRSDV